MNLHTMNTDEYIYKITKKYYYSYLPPKCIRHVRQKKKCDQQYKKCFWEHFGVDEKISKKVKLRIFCIVIYQVHLRFFNIIFIVDLF